jgi:nicotinamidase/pyrazinamidase
MATQTFPTLYDPSDIYKDYTPRTKDFMALGAKAGLPLAAKDKSTGSGALIIIDMQNDFVRPTGTLLVPGAEYDTQRLVEFIYRNAESITAIYATLDSHYPLQIFFGEWWENPQTGEHPADYTVVTYSDVRNGVWRARIDPVWSHRYLSELESRGKKSLMIWPKHTMVGTWGHNLVPALAEAIAWHSAARMTQPTFLTKGDVPHTERYGAFASEVEYPNNPRGGTDTQILDTIGRYDRTWWAGEAETHCVLESQIQAVNYFANQPDVLARMFFLMDCTSPITHPSIDFVGMARREQARMSGLGVRLVKSTDPMV